MEYTLGIDAGASSIKVVAVVAGAGVPACGSGSGGSCGGASLGQGALLFAERRVHEGAIAACTRELLLRAAAQLGAARCVGVATTGSGAPALVEAVRAAGGASGGAAPGSAGGQALPVLESIPALSLGASLLVPEARCVVEMGAQSSCFVSGLGGEGSGAPRPPRFSLNEGCASGTGAFFEDQMSRLGLSIEDYSAMVARAASVPRISGRCSVFAKTDIIHRQQEGVPVEDILLGLCYATVKSYKALIVRGAPVEAPVALSGGVLLNHGVVRAVREVFKFGEGELLCGEENLYLQAAGAALEAARLAGAAAGLGAAVKASGCGSGFAAEAGGSCVLGTAAPGSLAAGAGAVAAAEFGAVAAASPAAVPGAAPAATVAPAAVSAAAPGAAAVPGALPATAPAAAVSPATAPATAAAATAVPATVPAAAAVPGALPAVNLGALVSALAIARPASEALPRLAPLPDEGYVPGPGFAALPREQWPCDGLRPGTTRATLGIDAGSTSTNLVLLSLDGRLLDAQYLRTRGDARQAIRAGLASLEARLGGTVEIVAAATTGSGRALTGKFVGADAVVDEITCQAAGAAHVDPLVDTVFEIGGQDSKFIALTTGHVADFKMNKVCAAGTGSFIEEQAARLGIPLDEYGALALGAKAPVDLGERCTVFMESAINAALAAGANKADIAAGLASSIVSNYLNRVVATGRVGGHIVLQGGVAYNPAIVAAFRARMGERLSVSPNFAVSGAVGAALMAAEAAAAPDFKGTAFKGFDLSGAERAQFAVDETAVAQNRAFFRRTQELFLAGYSGQRDPARPTVGVPRCLMLHRLFPLANAFFGQLGFNVLLTDDTDEATVARAQELAQGETCFPVKLIYGHMAQLVEAGVDYIFIPRLHTIRHAGSHVAHNYACSYMQCAPELVARALDLPGHGIKLLSPELDMDFGEESMATAMLGVGAELGFSPEETAVAVMAGGFAVREFGEKTEELGDALLASLKPGERVLVLITRNYGTSDGTLNMGIPQLLLDRGQKVITLSHLHGHDVDLRAEHPSICWPFGQHILSGARLVRRDPRLFAVYLTNHGCGPDTMIDHLFAEEMGPKPYLQIEVDEHASAVGVATRVEAFLNTLAHLSAEDAARLSAPAAGSAASAASVPGTAPAGEEEADASGSALLASCGPLAGPAAEAPNQVEGATAGAVRPAVKASAAGPALAAAALAGVGFAVPDQGEPLVRERPVVLPGTGLHTKRVVAWLRGRGFAEVRVVPLDGAALEAGRAVSATKEYCSFTVLAGAALLAAGAPDGARVQLALPSSRGAEADSQYDRVIRAALVERGLVGVTVRAPRLDTLPWALASDAADELFEVLLEADAAYALPEPARHELLRSMEAQRAGDDATGGGCAAGEADAVGGGHAAEGAGTVPVGVGGAERAASLDAALRALLPQGGGCGDRGDYGDRTRRASLALVGEWPLVYADALTGGMWAGLEREGYRLLRMPLSECLWFLWRDALEEDQRSAGGAAERNERIAAIDRPDAEELERRAAVLARYRARMEAVSAQLGALSPFAADLDELVREAETQAGRLFGANARYRAAKAALERRRRDGVIVCASMYENIDTILQLMGAGEDAGAATDAVAASAAAAAPAPLAPVLHLAFDGTLDAAPAERLRSFLYYL